MQPSPSSLSTSIADDPGIARFSRAGKQRYCDSHHRRVSQEWSWWQWPHLLSLDAPAVAVTWLWWWASKRNVHLPTNRFVILGSCVWVIFISTPHRGSSLADWGIVRFLARLIAIPENLLQLSTQILTLNVELLNPSLRNSGLPGFSVIDSLSPSNPYFRAIEKQTIQRPFHSIIGDRGRDDTPNSSGGVVGYHSAHRDGARSEQIVPFGHSCTSQPLVFGAIHQLIRQELAAQQTKSNTKSSRP